MFVINAGGLNSALYKSLELLKKEGISEDCRSNTAGSSVVRLPRPVCIVIDDPKKRNITLAERNWNHVLPYAESIWLAKGMNNLDDGPGRYVKNLYNFSDDGKTWRAGYGPRIRHFTGSYEQYSIGKDFGGDARTFGEVDPGIDQLKYVIESFKRDPNTRQADITISDPAKDCFVNGELIVTKDTPCTRSLHFQKDPEGGLDLIVRMRSNDAIWGFSAVNAPNFTIMQEYVAWVLGIPVGKYYHIADNFHIYSNSFDMQDRILGYSEEYVMAMENSQGRSIYPSELKTRRLQDLDGLFDLIKSVEDLTYAGSWKLAEDPMTRLRKAPELFHDWAVVLAKENIRRHKAKKEVKKGLFEFRSSYMKTTIN